MNQKKGFFFTPLPPIWTNVSFSAIFFLEGIPQGLPCHECDCRNIVQFLQLRKIRPIFFMVKSCKVVFVKPHMSQSQTRPRSFNNTNNSSDSLVRNIVKIQVKTLLFYIDVDSNSLVLVLHHDKGYQVMKLEMLLQNQLILRLHVR